jgi:COP9 signalosome complex subunit 3
LKAAIGIRILKVALNKVALSPEHLTPVHALLAQVCLLSKNYQMAVQVLDRDVTEIDPAKTDIQPIDALLYFYYGGMIYIGLKQFKRAREFFSLAISSPAQVLSAIVVESYKKFILVSLLIEGQNGTLPKYTSNSVMRQLKGLTQSYADFAKAYQSHKQQTLQESYQKYSNEFDKDHNAGLAAQVVQSLYRRNIMRLTQTYVTLSLADIATSVELSGPKEAEEFILRMIEDGEIYASINQKDSMVSFKNNPEQYDNTNTLNSLDLQIRNAALVGNRVDDLHKKIASSHQYLMKISQSEKGVQYFDDIDIENVGEKHQGGVQVQ